MKDRAQSWEGSWHRITKLDILLIFDEILTGFRIAGGGAQEYYGVTADLACFAKALGSGAPIATVTGRKDMMGMIGPGKIGGTYNANPASPAVCHPGCPVEE